MNRHVIIAAFLLCSMSLFAQNNLKESNFHLGVELQTKYVWRGIEQIPEESAPVVFPQLNYQYKGFTGYVCGGYAINGKFSEIDLGVSYTHNWLTVGLTDYYYPTTNTPEDQYFNFKSRDTGHCFEGYINIAPENIPAYLLFSTFFAGEDKNIEGKQAYSTYGELGAHYDFLGGHQLGLAVGATFNKTINSCIQLIGSKLLLLSTCRRCEREWWTTIGEQAFLLGCNMLSICAYEWLVNLVSSRTQTLNERYRVVTYASSTKARTT